MKKKTLKRKLNIEMTAAATETTSMEQLHRKQPRSSRRGSITVISSCSGMHPDAERLWLMRRQRNETATLRRMWKESQKQQTMHSEGGSTHPQPNVSTELPLITNTRHNCVIENRMRHLRDIDSAKYYTALTRRPRKEHTDSYLALTSRWAPLPKLFGEEPKENISLAVGKSLDSWTREVVKEVTPRPDYTIEAPLPTVKKTVDETADPDDTGLLKVSQSHFYLATRSQASRHYTVNPEWTSERLINQKRLAEEGSKSMCA